MCGICGIVKFNSAPVLIDKLQQMMAVMKHRGPDDEGVFGENNVALGFVRLSIIDLSVAGNQPMFSADGRYVMVYNGEIYNYIELRKELEDREYRFKSRTDSEVLLNAYIEWGEDCLDKFNGMWAFAIYDRQQKELFCARDRYGIKPFYYYFDNDQFIFASELPAIIIALQTKPAPHHQSIFDFLVFNRTDQTESTFFRDIKKLQHGHKLRSKLNDLDKKPQIERWYDLREWIKKAVPFRQPEEFREIFNSAVGLRLRSDVPVGVCLSGGLDSSSIVAALLSDFDKKDLNTFSAVYNRGQRGDESEFIKEFQQLLSKMFYTTPTAETLCDDLNSFIRAHAEPIPTTAPYAQFKVMALARNSVVVTLDGQGADESLAGYHYFFGFFLKDLLKQLRLIKLFNESINYVLNHRSLFGIKSFVYFLAPQRIRTNLRFEEKGYLTPALNEYNTHSVIADELYGSGSLQDALINHFDYKLEHLLKWEDRNSMWFSLEARVPFLDYRIVERMLATSSDLIIRKGMTKFILREAMNGTLPERIRVRRDKVGFETPQDEWFRTKIFRRIIDDILDSPSFRKRELIDASKAKELYLQHLRGKINISKEIWKWIHLEMWHRKFIDERFAV